MQRVEVKPETQALMAKMLEQPMPPQYQGVCAGPCGRRIPAGYVPLVTEWEPVNHGQGLIVQKPKVMLCHECAGQVQTTGSKRSHNFRVRTSTSDREALETALAAKHLPTKMREMLEAKLAALAPAAEPEEEEAELTPKEIAAKLLAVMDETPHGSKRLCALAGIEYTDLIIPILKKLRDAGKVEFDEGKWVLVP